MIKLFTFSREIGLKENVHYILTNMVFTQPFLFTANLETRKDVRVLLLDFAKHLSKQLDPTALVAEMATLSSASTDDTPFDSGKFLQKQCTSKVRKYFNRKCRPQMMTACRLFLKENIEEIRTQSGGDFVTFNKVKTAMWNAVKADKAQFDDHTARSLEFNETHSLNVKKTKKRSGYLKFTMLHRPSIAAEHPDMSIGDVSKELGTMWRALSADERVAWKTRDLDIAMAPVVATNVSKTTKTSKKSKVVAETLVETPVTKVKSSKSTKVKSSKAKTSKKTSKTAMTA